MKVVRPTVTVELAVEEAPKPERKELSVAPAIKKNATKRGRAAK